MNRYNMFIRIRIIYRKDYIFVSPHSLFQEFVLSFFVITLLKNFPDFIYSDYYIMIIITIRHVNIVLYLKNKQDLFKKNRERLKRKKNLKSKKTEKKGK